MSAETEAYEKLKQLREDARQLDREIMQCRENLDSLYLAQHAIQARIHQLMREASA